MFDSGIEFIDKYIREEKAQDMFEKLGYKLLKDYEWKKELLNGRIIYFNKKEVATIMFRRKTVDKFYPMEVGSLTLLEIDATYKQLKELGWL